MQIELEHSGRNPRPRLEHRHPRTSALAYLAAINRLRNIAFREKTVTQHVGV